MSDEGKSLIIVTTPTLPGYEIVKISGPVHGLTVRTRGVGGKIVAGIEGIFGGEVTSYTSECEKVRRESLDRLTENAERMGANAGIEIAVAVPDGCELQRRPQYWIAVCVVSSGRSET